MGGWGADKFGVFVDVADDSALNHVIGFNISKTVTLHFKAHIFLENVRFVIPFELHDVSFVDGFSVLVEEAGELTDTFCVHIVRDRIVL